MTVGVEEEPSTTLAPPAVLVTTVKPEDVTDLDDETVTIRVSDVTTTTTTSTTSTTTTTTEAVPVKVHTTETSVTTQQSSGEQRYMLGRTLF